MPTTMDTPLADATSAENTFDFTGMLTAPQAAKLLGVHDNTIRNWVDNGRLAAAVTPGGHRRIPRAAVEALRADLLQQLNAVPTSFAELQVKKRKPRKIQID